MGIVEKIFIGIFLWILMLIALMLTALVCNLAWNAAKAEAQDRPLITASVVYVPGSGALTEQQARNAFNFASQDYWYQLGIDLKAIKWRRTSNIFNRALDYQSRKDRLRKWQGWFRRYDRSNTHVKLAILPPMIDSQGQQWIAGFATGTCQIGGTAYGDLEFANSAGQNRFLQSSLIIEHEIGHLIGASHAPACTVMAADACACSIQRGDILPWAEVSKRQIFNCIGK